MTKYEEKLKYLNWSANCSSRNVLSVNPQQIFTEKIKVSENLDWQTLEKIETNKFKLPGIKIEEDFMRIYPQKEYLGPFFLV